MPKKVINALNAVSVKHAKAGRHCDGGGLFLLVKSTGMRSWVFRYQFGGKVRDMGMGSASGLGAVTLAEARAHASDLVRLVRSGIDPLADRKAKSAQADAKAEALKVRAITFQTVATAFIETNEAAWRNAKHRAQWTSSLMTYAFPHFGSIPVAEVSTAHVMAALEPIWLIKPETASRVRSRVERVLDYAHAREWRVGENPARWRGHIANMLPKRAKVAKVEHHAAVPWRDIGAFMVTLRSREAIAAKALEFTILTAARTGEVLGARWSEFDKETRVWIIPDSRMKSGREHRVPLSGPALAVLADVDKLRSAGDHGFVFPGAKRNQHLSQMSMLMLLRRMGREDVTAHGFRSSFRDWCAEASNFPHEMAEIALAHVVGNKVEAAYRRGDMLEKRREMMESWASFCNLTSSSPSAQV